MVKNHLLLDVLSGKKVERPPVWLMRQAGRILPEYREVRASTGSFKSLVQNPELAATVTVQPVDALGVDAAIIFSDILVIPEAMGLDYEMIEKMGPYFPDTIKTRADIQKLDADESAADRLDYVYKAIDKTIEKLDSRVPLIGFCGAPWTIFTYMIEGQGSKAFTKARKFLQAYPQESQELLEKITQISIIYLKKQVKAGVSLVQIFDSWAGVLSREQYVQLILPHIKSMVEELKPLVPVIVFSKGAWHSLVDIQKECNPTVLGIDWTTDARWARQTLGEEQILQGNLDPSVLYSTPENIDIKTNETMQVMKENHIMNLGHGVYPDTPLENVRSMIHAVKNFRYE